MLLNTQWGFPGSSDSKESACNSGETGLIPGSRRSPGEGNGNPLQCSCLEKSHRQRSLVCCSSWGCRVGHDWAHTYTCIIFKLHCKELEDLTLSYIDSAQECTVLRISRTYPLSDVLYYVMMIIRLMKWIILPEMCD